LSVKRLEKIAGESLVKKQLKPSKLKPLVKLYNNYSDFTRKTFMYRMLNPQECELLAKVARDLDINYRTALRRQNYYAGTEEVVYRKSE
jgi:hypothetical protein